MSKTEKIALAIIARAKKWGLEPHDRRWHHYNDASDADFFLGLLAKAVKRQAIFYGLSFDGFFIDPLSYDDCNFQSSLPRLPYYERDSDGGYPGLPGLYVHIINVDVDDIVDYVRDFAGITGEVCFSDLGDVYLARHKAVIGVVMQATPTRSFDGDCWSIVMPDGTRRATARDNYVNLGRCEHWIVPSNGTIQYLFCCAANEVEVRKYADALGIGVILAEWVDDN